MSVLVNGGECGALIEAADWSATPLGPFESWPVSLRTLTAMMVASRQPMFITWGPSRIVLYNDAYALLLGHKHPDAMGRPIAEVWSEIWSDLAPIVADAYAGLSIQMDDVSFVMERNGFPEETHFAFSYTPVREEDGSVAGFFCACTETTGRVGAETRLRESEAEVRGVLDGMGEGFLLLDRDFRVRRINAEGLRLDGRPSEAILGRHLLDVWPDAERMPDLAALPPCHGGAGLGRTHLPPYLDAAGHLDRGAGLPVGKRPLGLLPRHQRAQGVRRGPARA